MPNMNARPPTISILPLAAEKLDDWIDGNVAARGTAEVSRLSRFWDDAQRGERVIFAAWDEMADEAAKSGVFAGHITVQDTSLYVPFRRGKIPEIVDLWVQPAYRQRGIARALLFAAENYARGKNAAQIGLGVGLTESYGAAQRLYALSGFVPDGSGVWAQGIQPQDGDSVRLDDGALLMWVKDL